MKKIFYLILFFALVAIGAFSSNQDSSSYNTNPKQSYERKLSQYDIIMMPGHPKYYDTTESARTFWEKYVGKEVILPGDTYYSAKDAAIIIEGYATEYNLLEDIQIRMKEKCSFDSALSIVYSYMPLKLMKEHYNYYDSYIIEYDTDTDIYLMAYRIKDESYQLREDTRVKGKTTYKYYTMPYTIYSMIWVKNDNVELIRINGDGDMDNSYWRKNKNVWYYNYLDY